MSDLFQEVKIMQIPHETSFVRFEKKYKASESKTYSGQTEFPCESPPQNFPNFQKWFSEKNTSAQTLFGRKRKYWRTSDESAETPTPKKIPTMTQPY